MENSSKTFNNNGNDLTQSSSRSSQHVDNSTRNKTSKQQKQKLRLCSIENHELASTDSATNLCAKAINNSKRSISEVMSPSLTGGINGHRSNGTKNLPLTKNVGVGANLTITRSNNPLTSTGHQLSNSRPICLSVTNSEKSSNCYIDGQLISNQSQLLQEQKQSPPTTAVTMNTSTILPELLHQQQGHHRSISNSSSSTSSSPLPNNPITGRPQPFVAQQQQPPSKECQPSPTLNNNKICSQNLNGTLSITSVPSNDSELQLFRVLQRANLLNYFDVMIELGGDDVQQLCEAGEEEFLEIMALVGMASKPLHVRRLQKSLQEFMTQPSLFPGPIIGPPLSAFNPGISDHFSTPTTSVVGQFSEPSKESHQMPIRPIPHHTSTNNLICPNMATPSNLNSVDFKTLQMKFLAMRNSIPTTNSSISHVMNELSSRSSSPASSNPSPSCPNSFPLPSQSPTLFSTATTNNNASLDIGRNNLSPSTIIFPTPSPASIASSSQVARQQQQMRIPTLVESSHRRSPVPTSTSNNFSSPIESPQLDSRTSLSPIPFLQDHEKQKIIEAAVKIVDNLPTHMREPRISKRKGSADYENVTKLAEDDPRRTDEIRKYSPIYGRYDCKRKVQKPLTIHELSVNEAAAQLCLRVPELLTRRDELFLLSRQVVRDAGLPYSSIISSSPAGNALISQMYNNTTELDETQRQLLMENSYALHNNNNSGKRMRLGESEDCNRSRFELESDTSSQSQHSSCSGAESLESPLIPFELSSRIDSFITAGHNSINNNINNRAAAFELNLRRNSSEPDDLSLGKLKNNEHEEEHCISNNSLVNMKSTLIINSSRSTKRLNVKAEPR